MSASTFIARVNAYWQKRLVRILVALLILAGAIYLQYWLANIPLPVDVETSKPPNTPAGAALVKHEELVIEGPTIDNSGGATPSRILLSGEGTKFVAVEARFDSGEIGSDFIDLLRTDPEEKSLPTQDRQLIVFSAMPDEAAAAASGKPATPEKQQAAPCRTSIDVKLPEGAKMPAALHFLQVSPGSDQHRSFEMEVEGADVVVELMTSNLSDSATGEMQGTDCGKHLSIGPSWSRSFTAPAPIDVVVPAGSSFRFSFTSPEGKMPWSGGGKFYEPFKLVALPLNVRAVKTVKHEASSAASPSIATILDAESVADKPPLVLKYFRVGSENLELDFAGEAMVRKNGEAVFTFSLVDFIKGNPILAGILAMLDAALLEWIRRALFKGNQSPDKA
jgi:hypothetical protein